MIERIQFKIEFDQNGSYDEEEDEIKSLSLIKIIEHAYKFKKTKYMKYVMVTLKVDIMEYQK